METKPVYLSKTVWTNLLLAVAVFYGPASQYLQGHPDILAIVFSGVNLVLRFATKAKLALW